MDYKKVTSCRVCNSYRLRPYLDLGEVHLCNQLVKSQDDEVDKYPLEVLLCEDCHLSQLSIVVDPEVLYKDYVYHSSVSQTFKDHCYQLALTLKSEWMPGEIPEGWAQDPKSAPGQMPTVLDIASNDGCLLEEFRRAGFAVIGNEPSHNLAEKCREKLIPVLEGFWSEKLADSYFSHGNRRHFITATNVFAHVDDLRDFLRGVYRFLASDGVFVVEVPYLGDLIEKTEFDTIYHEHLSYFLLKPLVKVFKDNKFNIFRVERTPIHGGSIRIYAAKYRPVEQSVTDFLEEEETKGFYSFSTYSRFADRVELIRERFRLMLEILLAADKKIVGYGASAKGISLLNYCGISHEAILSIVDDTPAKQGMLTPGSKIPIVSSEFFQAIKPDVIVLLAWNFAQELMDKTKWHKEAGGHYLIPIPDVRVV